MYFARNSEERIFLLKIAKEKRAQALNRFIIQKEIEKDACVDSIVFLVSTRTNL